MDSRAVYFLALASEAEQIYPVDQDDVKDGFVAGNPRSSKKKKKKKSSANNKKKKVNPRKKGSPAASAASHIGSEAQKEKEEEIPFEGEEKMDIISPIYAEEEEENCKPEDALQIYVNCNPIAKFYISVDPQRKIDDMMTMITSKVKREHNTAISVLRLQFCGDGDVTKGIPYDLKVGELLEDQDEVQVEFTVQTAQYHKNQEEDVSTDDESEVFVCPFTFSGPTAIQDLKLHLAKVKPMPSVPKKGRDGRIHCPLYFFNQEDAAQHMQESCDVDLRTFWERTEEEAIKHSSELIKTEQMQKEPPADVKKKKKSAQKKQKRQQKMKQTAEEEKRRMQLEQELKVEQKLQVEKRRKAKEAMRVAQSVVVEIIYEAQCIIESNLTAKKVEKKKGDKKVQESDRKEVQRGSVHKGKKKKGSKKKRNKSSHRTESIPIEVEEVPSPPEVVNPPPVAAPKESEPEKHVVVLQSDKYYAEAVVSKLHKDIELHVSQLQSIVDKARWRADQMLARVRQVVSRLWPESKTEVYGSYATSLCIPSSDLDLVVIGVPYMADGEVHPIPALAAALQQEDWIESLQAIETAKVPVIKVTSKDEGIPTDITFDTQGIANVPVICTPEGTLAHHKGQASIQLLRKFMDQIPDMTHLVMILKQLLHERGLNNSYTGGLSSYCLVLMIVSFLQLYGNNGSRKKNLGILLLDFLEFYGTKFDYQSMGISVTGKGCHFALGNGTFSFPARTAALVIVDPFDPANNVSQHVSGITKVKSLFVEVHKALMSPFFSTFTPATLLDRVLSNPPETIRKPKQNGNKL